MTEKNQTKIDKKTYTKPQVTQVSLVAGEAVLGNCKNGPSAFSDCFGQQESCGSDSLHS